MHRFASFLFSLWLALTPAFADSSFVAPTANGTAAVGQLPGTTTNDAGCATCVGFSLEASTALNTVSLTTVTDATVTGSSVALTAGDWEVSGTAYFLAAGTTTVNYYRVSVSTSTTVSATPGDFGSLNLIPNSVVSGGYYTSVSTPIRRISLSGNTTYNLNVNVSFGVSTMTAGGWIHARRTR